MPFGIQSWMDAEGSIVNGPPPAIGLFKLYNPEESRHGVFGKHKLILKYGIVFAIQSQTDTGKAKAKSNAFPSSVPIWICRLDLSDV